MTVARRTKINYLLQHLPAGSVATAVWLRHMGVPHSLQQAYQQSGWLQPIGTGALVRSGQQANWMGALHALQKQLHLPVYVGGYSALEFLGKAHYPSLGQRPVSLWLPRGVRLPKWFLDNCAGQVHVNRTTMLPGKSGYVTWHGGDLPLVICTAERAMLQCCWQVPHGCSFAEAHHLMQGLVDLRPKVVQTLLRVCRSVKAKRLFLFLAQHTGQPWLRFLKPQGIDLGKGPRQIVSGGKWDKAYQITVPAGAWE